MIKLGTIVTDKVTGLEGMLTHLQTEMNGDRFYSFQPKGLDKKTLLPLDPIWVVEDRIEGGIEMNMPIEIEEKIDDILGTEVEDKASGFKGTAICAVYHINGCLHVDIQPKGTNPETGKIIDRHNFDIRRLKGDAIEEKDEKEVEYSKVRFPSPAPVTSYMR